jgi:hypothetical protein
VPIALYDAKEIRGSVAKLTQDLGQTLGYHQRVSEVVQLAMNLMTGEAMITSSERKGSVLVAILVI